MQQQPVGQAPHEDCQRVIRNRMAVMGCEVTVSETPPLIRTKWTEAMTCPHGVTLYYEPTSDQRAAWIREGVE